MEDRDIIDLFWQRNEKAIEETGVKYGKLLFSVANNILSNREDSEETVNDTYRKTWDNIPPTKPNFLSAFLCKIARNLALNLFSKNHAGKRGNGTETLLIELAECVSNPPDEEFFALELTSIINDWLSVLSKEDRVMFVKRYFYGYDVKEIAVQIGIRPNIISSKLFRLREKLAQKLETEGYLSERRESHGK